MGYRTRIDTELGVAYTVADGPVSPLDVRLHRRQLGGHPAFVPTMRQILDLRQARLALDAPTFRGLVRTDPFAEGARRAVLVSDDLHWGLARMYGAWMDDRRIDLRPFRTVEEACAWLELPVEAVSDALEGPDRANRPA